MSEKRPKAPALSGAVLESETWASAAAAILHVGSGDYIGKKLNSDLATMMIR